MMLIDFFKDVIPSLLLFLILYFSRSVSITLEKFFVSRVLVSNYSNALVKLMPKLDLHPIYFACE